jgi:hypothetical protein
VQNGFKAINTRPDFSSALEPIIAEPTGLHNEEWSLLGCYTG